MPENKLADPTAPPWPMVSIIMPVRQEADFIEKAVRSILASDYPADRIEVLVVDGMSTDETHSIVQSLAAEDERVRLLDNPERIVPHAMNTGIRAARGEIILRVDGHALIATDFVRQSVQALFDHPEAWCAGGAVTTLARTYVGRAIAGAMTSPVGVGNAMFRLGSFEGYVDTIAWGAYWKWVFERIGLFDEELIRNQDDELNLRLILAGGKIWMTPKVQSEYYPRTTLGKLARQYYQYGFWRIRTIQKHRQPATLRQIAPLVFVLCWLILIAGTLIWSPIGYLLLVFASLYLLGLGAGTLDVMRRCGLRESLLAPIIFAILHFAYGLGSLSGIVQFVVFGRGGKVSHREYQLSR